MTDLVKKSFIGDRRRTVFDVAIAGLLFCLSLSILVSVAHRRPDDRIAVVVGLLIVHCGSLIWRRSSPLHVMVINLASGAAIYALGYPPEITGVAVLVALYSVASLCDRQRSLTVLIGSTVVMAVALAVGPAPSDGSTIVGNAAVFGVIWFLGDSQRARREYVVQLEQRTAELERARHELASQAVMDERLRIARELHDVVAHSMGVVAVQAGVGAHVIDSRPQEAKRALEVIEEASKSALDEIRRTLGLLRGRDGAVGVEPAPTVVDLPGLADKVRNAGVDVELHTESLPGSLPLGMQLTIYRIVQEALTNVLKHAAATRARVGVRLVDGVVRVEVVDDGSGVLTGTPSVGMGLAGMRERVSLYGGKMESGPLAEGGFRVYVEIPVGEDTQ